MNRAIGTVAAILLATGACTLDFTDPVSDHDATDADLLISVSVGDSAEPVVSLVGWLSPGTDAGGTLRTVLSDTLYVLDVPLVPDTVLPDRGTYHYRREWPAVAIGMDTVLTIRAPSVAGISKTPEISVAIVRRAGGDTVRSAAAPIMEVPLAGVGSPVIATADEETWSLEIHEAESGRQVFRMLSEHRVPETLRIRREWLPDTVPADFTMELSTSRIYRSSGPDTLYETMLAIFSRIHWVLRVEGS